MGKLAMDRFISKKLDFLRSVIIPPTLRTYTSTCTCILTEAHRLDPFWAALQKEMTLFQFFKIKKKIFTVF